VTGPLVPWLPGANGPVTGTAPVPLLLLPLLLLPLLLLPLLLLPLLLLPLLLLPLPGGLEPALPTEPGLGVGVGP
jgi:hypothetical protein